MKRTFYHVGKRLSALILAMAALVSCAGTGRTVPTASSPARIEQVSSAATPQETEAFTTEKVTFQNEDSGLRLVGILFRPASFDESCQYPAIVVAGPMLSVKEQAQSLYAGRLAEAGYVTLVFDYSYFGESDGEPRQLELPDVKASDISSAVSYLQSLSFVDKDRIGGLGICGSGSYMPYAATKDERIRAVTSVVPATTMSSMLMMPLAQAEADRAAYEAGRAAPTYIDLMPRAYAEGAAYYYNEERGWRDNWDNHAVSWSELAWVDFHPADFIAQLKAPYLVITGENAWSRPGAEELYRNAVSEKELYVIEGAGHFDMYDLEPYLTQALERIIPFFDTHLKNELNFPLGFAVSGTFTGDVYFSQLIPLDDVYNFPQTNHLTFAPSARSYWHSHGGMLMLGTGGVGYYQEEGKPVQVIRAGDVVECPEGVRHWHGAAPDHWFSQIVIYDASYTAGGEPETPVTDAEYASLNITSTVPQPARDTLFPHGETALTTDTFSGPYYLSSLIGSENAAGAPALHYVAFEPGTVSNWHTHEGGQILIATDGVGYHQLEGGEVEVLQPGDVAFCPPGVAHWHGAAPGSRFAHIAANTNPERAGLTWGSRVTPEQIPDL